MTSTKCSSPSICVDVTTLLNWHRPAVGIVRVEQQLCRWLFEQSSEGVHFVVYNRTRGEFHECPRTQLQAHLESLDRCSAAHQVSSELTQPNLEERLRRRALHLLARTPSGLRLTLHSRLIKARPVVHQLVARARNLRNRMNASRTTTSVLSIQECKPFDLPTGSVYISLGLDWDYKDMAQIYRIKQARQLKVLLFCYDIIPVRLPHLCVADVSRRFAHYFVDLAWCADIILCISESSRRDLQGFLLTMSVPLPRCEVVRLGGDVLPGQGPATQLSEGVARYAREPFILFVSTIERRKNHEILYRAYTRLAEEGIKLPLLIFVGMPGWGVGELHADIALDPRTQGRIHALNNVTDAELAHLYQRASFTVYPSLYEGWGLPVGESLAYGKFCICANTSSLPEVGESWVEYLDPWDLPGWVDRLRYYITHPEEVARRNSEISDGYKPHLWRQTAADIYGYATRLQQLAAQT